MADKVFVKGLSGLQDSESCSYASFSCTKIKFNMACSKYTVHIHFKNSRGLRPCRFRYPRDPNSPM